MPEKQQKKKEKRKAVEGPINVACWDSAEGVCTIEEHTQRVRMCLELSQKTTHFQLPNVFLREWRLTEAK